MTSEELLMDRSKSDSKELAFLKAQIASLEQLLGVYEKSVIEQTDKLYTEIAERKRAEEALHSSEAELSKMIQKLQVEIDERKKQEKKVEHQATHDGLTGLPNRNLLTDRVKQAVFHADRHKQRIAVLFIDLDNFKLVNDGLGHPLGDKLLKTVAERLEVCVRSSDTVARQGGDEFVVVLSNLIKSEEAAPVARKIQAEISRPFTIDGHHLEISCSIGISIYPGDGTDVEDLLKNADAAMYRAKDKGRGTFQYYTRGMNDRIVARMNMERNMRHALENGELAVYYQPQVELNSGKLIGLEALLRWRSPELGMLLPSKFISLAEETGLIVPIGEWVLKTACMQNKAYQDAKFPPMTVSVNLSARQFREKELAGIIARILRETGLEPRWLELEIVESMVMQDVERSAAILDKLKALGVQLSIDDFGTGYSSLSYLKRFPFDKLKIDITFVREITTDPQSAAIVKSIIAMARSLNLRVIAEGIETEGQLVYLRDHGCDEIQGFYFSHALPAHNFELLLREDRRLLPLNETEDIPEKTLLLIDDDPSIIEAFSRVLHREGYRILGGYSAQQGFELMSVNRIGVVVCDVRMPGMSGIEFLSRIKTLYPDVIRIALTGYADLDVITELVNRGAIYKFINKPLMGDTLQESLRDAFRHYELALQRGCQLD